MYAGVPVKFVKLLRLWYSRQTCAVLWNSVLGDRFDILCGVRQGGVLSPILFSTYIDDVICVLRNSGYGICIGSVFIGCVVYADDIILLSASCHGIQKLAALCVHGISVVCLPLIFLFVIHLSFWIYHGQSMTTCAVVITFQSL